ncbi:MAG: hypothetical protein GKR93_04045 [Gammaproteobacteria bacterium]|nr:hypothetical protein [Gammaproteobacteria bacterium]
MLLFLSLQTNRQNQRDNYLLSDLDKQTIHTINIHRKNGSLLSFEKQGGVWWLTGATRLRAKRERIEAILGLAKSRSFAEINPANTPLNVYQLQPAEMVLDLDQHRFIFGGTDPIDARRYVLYNNVIHLINDNLFHQLGQANLFFLSTKLIAEDETILRIDFGDQLLSLSRDSWAITPPAKDQSENLPAVLASSWQKAEARSVSAYKRIQKLPLISVHLYGGRTAIFDVVSNQSELILARADLGIQYNFASGHAEKLLLKTD